MRRGPAPKPTKTKQLAGNPGKRRLNQHEARLAPEQPPCPKHLKGEARTAWKLLSPMLYGAGLLTGIDAMTLAALCSSWGRMLKAEAMLAKQGIVVHGVNGTMKTNPWFTVYKAEKENVRKFMVEFGMSPASRSRVKAEEMGQMSLAELLFAKTKADE